MTPVTDRSTFAAGVVSTARALGWELMAWQQLVLRVGLVHEDGQLVHRDVDVAVCRQQGKSSTVLSLIVNRMLAAPDQWCVYGAQSRLAGRRRLLKVWWPRLKRSRLGGLFEISRGTGSESLEARNGSLLTLLSIDEAAAHGDVVDLGILDECWSLDADAEQAIRPGMLTKPNAQLWRFSTAGKAKSAYWRARVDAGRTAAALGVADGAAYLEWCALPDQDPTDPATWYGCMPALGHTISEETVRKDLASGMPLAEFKRSHLNLWPDESLEGWRLIDQATWEASRL
jgi:hypothetical protein